MLVVSQRLVTAVAARSGRISAARSVSDKVPAPTEVGKKGAVYDETTHTGQRWDKADYRQSRFELSPKHVNPNFAADLVAEDPPIACNERVVFCDGKTTLALGHPKIYINLDRPGTHACGYCGKRYYNKHTTTGDALDHHEIQV